MRHKFDANDKPVLCNAVHWKTNKLYLWMKLKLNLTLLNFGKEAYII